MKVRYGGEDRCKNTTLRKGEKEIGNSKLSACKCVVGGCKMFPNLDAHAKPESDEAEMFVSFRRCVDYNGRCVHAPEGEDPGQTISYNFCRRHGRLIVCSWYLLNQQKIWTDDFYRKLSMHNRGRIVLFNNSSEALHQFLLNSGDVLNRYKRRAESAIMYVEHYIAMLNAGMGAIENRNKI
jgi:hypothetical protein